MVKRILNTTTGRYYAIRQKTTASGTSGQIMGLWSPKRTVAKTSQREYDENIKYYTKINESYDARVYDGYLWVKITNVIHMGSRVMEGRVGRILRKPYEGTLESAIYEHERKKENKYDSSMSQIDRCLWGGEVIKKGRLIQ